VQQRLIERAILVGIQRSQVAVEHVIRLLGAIRSLQRGLHLEGMPKRAQYRPDQLLLGLGLVVAWDISADDRGNRGERLCGIVRQQLPLGTLRQRDIQIVVGKKLLVGVPLGKRERKLDRRHSTSLHRHRCSW
jgi:hypothetical protein